MLSLGLSITSPAIMKSGFSPAALALHNWWQPSDIATLFQDTAAATPVTADGQTVARMNAKVGASNALQATASLRPAYKDLSGAKLIRSDGVDDYMAADLTGLSLAYAAIANRYGWMVTGAQSIGGATAWRLPLNDPEHVMLRATNFTAPDLASLASYFGTTQQYAVFTTYDTTIFHRFDTTPATQITFIGANGVQYQTTNNNVTTDVGAQGLTAPVTMLIPQSAYATLSVLYAPSNGLAGCVPALPSGLLFVQLYTNQLTGSIPALPSTLATFFGQGNQFTGSIPAFNASLQLFQANDNKLTGYAGTSISSTLGDVKLQNNLLTQTAVDAILVQLAAAGKSTGTRVLNLGGTGNATPSAIGLAAKATLEGLGWTVTVN
jgi:hypothetical protein